MGSSRKYGSACLAIFLGLVIGQGLAFGAENRLTVTTPERTVSFTLEELKKKLPVVIWKMKLPHWAFPWAESDPVYGKESEYEGFELSEILKLAGFDVANESLKADELVLEALDGYNPSVPLDEIRANHALVAFRVKGLKDRWRPVQQGKAMLSPAPFFILWEKKAAEKQHLPWLYQLAKLELVTFSRKFAKLYPEGARADSPEMRGFLIFKTQCLKCHSVNLQGGDLGPELNVPQNVTEYWTRQNLLAFVRDASSFRAKSKMPTFKSSLKDSEIADVLRYLEAMKKRKIQP